MKLDRNIHPDGRDKYALVRLRRLRELTDCKGRLPDAIAAAIQTLEEAGLVDYGDSPASEFFVVRLRDKFAGGPLMAYAERALVDGDEEYALEVMTMAKRAGTNSPHCKTPD